MFPNAACVVSLVDRLMHRAEVVRIEGESYRAKEAEEREAARARPSARAAATRRARQQGRSRRIAAHDSAAPLPPHWTPEQALAVFECLHALREQLWAVYGPPVQQAWRDQLVPHRAPPEFDPDLPF